MKTTTIHCDICGTLITERGDDSAHPLNITIHCNSQNPMWMKLKLVNPNSGAQTTELKLEHTCDFCRKTIATAVTEAIIKIHPHHGSK